MNRSYLHLRRAGFLIVPILLAWTLAFVTQAQSISTQPAAPAQQPTPDSLPHSSSGSLHGTVTDSAGDVIVGAHVTLVSVISKQQRVILTDGTGVFTFPRLDAGTFDLTVTSGGFAPAVIQKIALASGETQEIPDIKLQISTANTTIRVNVSNYGLAEEQMHAQEKQRVLGVIPNFYASYVWRAEPLTSGQKFRLALRSMVDPVTFLATGAIAGIEQSQNNFSGYGQGTEGYAKRYGASYTDSFIGTMLGGAVLPSILHQDPRYFVKGTGSIRSRALYAISTVVICRGDNGRWQPNYSNVFGTLGSAAISNIYYPASDRGTVTIDNALIATASGAVGALFQEFVIRKISRGVSSSPQTKP